MIRVADHNVVQIVDAMQLGQVLNWGLYALSVPQAWSKTRGRGVKVAVLDTGIDVHHPDLAPNLKGGVNFTSGNPSDIQDRQGHGTHVAGIIAACDNGIGVVGVAPEAELYAVKVLNDDGSGNFTALMRGLRWCVDHGIDIACMSLGTHVLPPSYLYDIVKYAYQRNLIMVVAAGNENRSVCYPAAYDEVIAVGAIAPNQARAPFSNYGRELDVVAPGVNILFTYPVGRYAILSGTSMAAPFVAGTLALYVSWLKMNQKSYTISDIFCLLSQCSRDLGLDGFDMETGYGLFDVSRLLA